MTLCTLLSSQGSDTPDFRPYSGLSLRGNLSNLPTRPVAVKSAKRSHFRHAKAHHNTTKNTTQPVTHTRWEAFNPSPTQTLLKQEPYVELATIWSHMRPGSTAAFRTFGVRIDTLRSHRPPVKTPPTRACRTPNTHSPTNTNRPAQARRRNGNPAHD